MKIKKQTLKTVAVLFFASVTSLSFANNQVEKVTRELSGATKIAVTNGIKVNLTQGYNESVSIMAPEGKSALVSTEVTNGILRISYAGEASETKDVFVYVTMKNVDFIQVEDGAQVSAYEELSTNSLQFICKNNSKIISVVKAANVIGFVDVQGEVNLTGVASNVDIKANEQSKVTADLQSVDFKSTAENQSEIQLKGKAKNLELKADGKSTIKASEMDSKTCEVNASQDSHVLVCTKKRANLTANSSSKITISGSPQEKQVMASEDSDIIFN